MSDTPSPKKAAPTPAERRAEVEKEITTLYAKFRSEGSLVKRAAIERNMDALLDEWNKLKSKKKDETQQIGKSDNADSG